ncbi:MAG: hypothetical protein K8R21_12190, partial [Leptospira sp.]|nr:hypothetical protein [Leptospira sp.]
MDQSEKKVRDTLQSMLTGIKGQYSDAVAGDAKLNSDFGDMEQLVADIQSKLDANAPLDQIATQMSDFFQAQKQYAIEKRDYWNTEKVRSGTQRDDGMVYNSAVGSASMTCVSAFCSGGNTYRYVSQIDMYGSYALQGEVMNTFGGTDLVNGNGGGLPVYFNVFNPDQLSVFMPGLIQSSSWSGYPIIAFVPNGVEATPPYDNFSWNFNMPIGYNPGISGFSGPSYFGGNYQMNYSFSGYDKYQISINQKMIKAMRGIADINVSGVVTSQSSKLLFRDPADGIEKEESVSTIDMTSLTGGIMTGLRTFIPEGKEFSLQTDFVYNDANSQSNQDQWQSLADSYSDLSATFLAMVS